MGEERLKTKRAGSGVAWVLCAAILAAVALPGSARGGKERHASPKPSPAPHAAESGPEAGGEGGLLELLIKRRKALDQREVALKSEERRLDILRRETEEKIERYARILERLEGALAELKRLKEERFKRMVKVYEAMPAEQAARRISALDEDTAAGIILAMKSKKAGAVLSHMGDDKSTAIARRILSAKAVPADEN